MLQDWRKVYLCFNLLLLEYQIYIYAYFPLNSAVKDDEAYISIPPVAKTITSFSELVVI